MLHILQNVLLVGVCSRLVGVFKEVQMRKGLSTVISLTVVPKRHEINIVFVIYSGVTRQCWLSTVSQERQHQGDPGIPQNYFCEYLW